MRKWILISIGVLLVALIAAYYGFMHPMPDSKARNAIGEYHSIDDYQGAKIVLHHVGKGPEIVMFASAGRESSDFNELAQALADAGYKATLFEAPGINTARARKPEPTLYDLADDVGLYLDTREDPVIVLGHAFGNRVARATATRHPDKVRGVILIAAGSTEPIPPEANEALFNCFDPRLTASARRKAVRYAFFHDDSEMPDYWMRGWHRTTALMQGAATAAVDPHEWWQGGDAPMLVLAGMQDRIAPPEDTIDLLEKEFADRVTPVRIEGAGHAILPEQPEAITSAILDWLETLETSPPNEP